MLYPEGERTIDGVPKTFKKGAAILAAHLKVPIYPVAIEGFYEAWPRGQKFQKFTPLQITICDPVVPPAGPPTAQTYEQLIDKVREEVVREWERMSGKKDPRSAGQAVSVR